MFLSYLGFVRNFNVSYKEFIILVIKKGIHKLIQNICDSFFNVLAQLLLSLLCKRCRCIASCTVVVYPTESPWCFLLSLTFPSSEREVILFSPSDGRRSTYCSKLLRKEAFHGATLNNIPW